MEKSIRVYDINWFYNYEDHTDILKEEYDATFNAEPTEMIIDVSDWDQEDLQDDCIEDRISDYISDESGYYHEGYSFEWVKESIKIELTPQEIKVIQKALKTDQYIIERVINGDQVLDEATIKEAIDSILIMKAINLKLNTNE